MDSTEISRLLGHYMLLGWTMIDNCSKCGQCPRMKKGNQEFCLECDGEPGSQRRTSNSVLESPSPSRSSLVTPSTPPTPFSDHQELTPLTAIDPVIAAARRAQSDAASKEIGARLLQGWVMLAQECSNADCIGIPLMRAPQPRARASADGQDDQLPAKTGRRAGKRTAAALADPRKVCVVCHQSYLDEADLPLFEAWQAQTQSVAPVPQASTSGGNHIEPEPRPRKRTLPPSTSQRSSQQPSKVVKTGEAHTDGDVELSTSLHYAQSAIHQSLQNLTTHLHSLHASHGHVKAIEETAKAIAAVAQSLKDVREIAASMQ